MNAKNHSHAVETARDGPNSIDFDDYASYEDGDSLVVCDRENANAWVKSDLSVELKG